jgi:hypothetical protein
MTKSPNITPPMMLDILEGYFVRPTTEYPALSRVFIAKTFLTEY